ncbi:hypothetical protein EDB83DRAFT_2444339 [Lactarius deliciosus]|nr:hypothetical protein EDB83DRAFT_2444339 [Lactarius deliciosus]
MQPAWQTDELQDEWPEEGHSGDDCYTRSISLTVPVGSQTLPVGDVDPGGTFLIRQDVPSAFPQKTPGRAKSLIKDFFSPIPLERMFDPPTPRRDSSHTVLSPPTHGRLPHRVPPSIVPAASSRIISQSGLVNSNPSEAATFDSWRPNMHCPFTFTVPDSAPSPRVTSPGFARTKSTPGIATSVVPMVDPPLRLFQFQYDTFTRDHLSAMVDSIAINSPSGSNAANHAANTSSPFGLPTVSEASGPFNSIELRSAKRVKLSPVSDFDDSEYGSDCGTRGLVCRKDYVGESRSLMARIKNARDISILSTPVSITSAAHSDAKHDSSGKMGVQGEFIPFSDGIHSSGANENPVAITYKRKAHSSLGYRQQAENLMAQLKQDMKGSKRIFSTDATDLPPTQIPGVSNVSQAISPVPGIPSLPSPSQIQLGPRSPVQESYSPKTSFLDNSSTSLNTSRIYARFPAPPILVAPPPSPPPGPPDPTPRPSTVALQVNTQTNATFLAPAARTAPSATSILGRQTDDLNRFVSSSTVSGTTLTTGSSGSFVKHPGPAHITRIAPEDIPSLPERVGKMVFDKVKMRWVKATVPPALKAPESSSAGHAAGSEIDADSEDPFHDIESLRDDSLLGDGAGEPALASTDNSYIDEVGDDEEMELTSFSFDGPSHSHMRAPGIVGEDDTTDSDDDDEVTEISALSASLSLAGPPEIVFDPNSSKDEPHHGHTAIAVVGTPGPSRAMLMPTPIRSALKSVVASPAVSLVDPLASNYRTPASKSGHRRSVSFSDGKREGPIRGLGRGTNQDISSDIDWTKAPGGEPSFVPSIRSKRIGEMLDGLQNTGTSIDENSDNISPSRPRPIDFVHVPTGSSFPGSDHDLSVDDASDTEIPASDLAQCAAVGSQYPISSNVATAGAGKMANATFLTEASFGMAHDMLVQVITDMQPFEPYWEDLSSIDLSNKNIESVARLNEFLPQLRTLIIDSNQLAWLSGVPGTVRSLAVSRNSLTSATSFRHLLGLENLDISYNNIESLSQLECLRHLRELRADGNHIKSLDGLQHMDCLVKLSLQRNHIANIDFTHCSWPRLEALNVSQNRIQRVAGLHLLPSLVVLNLDNNSLDEPELHGILPRLRILRLSANRLKRLDSSYFPSLRVLYIDNNSLTEITKADRLVRLESLSLRNQGGNSLSLSIRDVRDAKRLYLSGNALPAHFLSEPCYNLIYLEIAACRLSKLPANFSTLVPNLRVLNLNYNFLEDVKPLEGLHRLNKLTIIGSRLKGTKGIIKVLRGCPDVEMVDFRMNPCTLGWYLPLLVKDVPGALQPSEPSHHASGERRSESASKPSGPELGQKGAGTSIRGGNRGNPRVGTTGVAPTLAWHELDAKFRRDLPDEAYIGRLTYRGLVMRACSKVRMLDGVVVSRKEREKAEKLLEGVARAKG